MLLAVPGVLLPAVKFPVALVSVLPQALKIVMLIALEIAIKINCFFIFLSVYFDCYWFLKSNVWQTEWGSHARSLQFVASDCRNKRARKKRAPKKRVLSHGG